MNDNNMYTTMIIQMIAIMFVAGGLSTMNVWANSLDDVRIHINDLYMVVLMIGWSTLLASLFYLRDTQNYTIPFLSVAVILIVLYLIRSQTFVDDSQFLEGMIPHHSMAITMSRKIKDKTNNPKIKKLAEDIITAQEQEIKYMNELLT